MALAFQQPPALRFELGADDLALLAAPAEFYASEVQTGPDRERDGSVVARSFEMRHTALRPSLRVPVAWSGGRVKLRVRSHRFGLSATVVTRWRDEEVNRTDFTPSTPPWSGTTAWLPPDPLGGGLLEIRVEGASGERRGLPRDFGVALDRFELERETSTWWLPTASQVAALASALLLLVAALGQLRASRAQRIWGCALVCAVAALVLLVQPTALRQEPWRLVVFPALALGLTLFARLVLRARSEAVQGVLLAGGAAVVALAIGEWGLRLADAAPAEAAAVDHLRVLQPNPSGRGSYRLKPDLRQRVRVGNLEVEIRTNRFGMPWREVARDRAPGRLRVAFLGDSFTFGCWTPSVESSYVGVFDQHLRDTGVEALNFGVGGYGPLDEELLLREEVLGFDPQVVVVGLFTGNDFRDAFLGLGKDRIEDGVAVLDEQIVRLRVPAEFVGPGARRLTEADRLRYRDPLEEFAIARRLVVLFDIGRPTPLAVSDDFVSYEFWSRDPLPAVGLQAVEETWAAYSRMRDTLAARGTVLAIVAIPTRQQVYSLDERGPGFDVRLPQSLLERRARAEGVPYLDLLPPLRAVAADDWRALYLAGDTHLGPHGHRVVGERVAGWFEEAVRPRLPAGAAR